MRKTYIIRVEIFMATDDEYKMLHKHMRKNGFKKVAKRGMFWEISTAIKTDADLTEIHSHVRSILEKIDHSKVRVTTEFKTS